MRKTEKELNWLCDKICTFGKNRIDCDKVFTYRLCEDGRKVDLEKQERYRWHDLRKNPDDMQSKDALYWIHGKW